MDSASADKPVVFGVVTDPEPHQFIALLDGQRAVMQTHSHGPETTDLLELQARVSLIGFQQNVIGVGKPLYFGRQRAIAIPEAVG